MPDPQTPTDPEYGALCRASADIGADPMLIQAAGGNTSIKDGDVMWIKASGTLLADALNKDIFVSVDLPDMRRAVAAGEGRADQPAEFALVQGGLRPSIETSLHAVFGQKVVMHAHCVHTLAHAVRKDCKALMQAPLDGLNWGIVDYVKPGANLARLVSAVAKGPVNVVVLQNHGIIVAGDTVEETYALMMDVHERLRIDPSAPVAPDLTALASLTEGSGYTLPDYALLHQLALDPARLKQATGGSLYPDHVIFCGIGATALLDGETPDQAAAKLVNAGAPAPAFLIVPGKGVVVRRDASEANHALIRCLVDVLLRVPADADLNYLTDAQNFELLNWDAEKYRSTLNG